MKGELIIMDQKDHQDPRLPIRRNLMDEIDTFFQQDPFRGILKSIDDFFEKHSFFAGFSVRQYESGDEWIVEAELPGVKQENIHIELLGDRIRIAIENDVSMETKNEEKSIQTHERRFERAERLIVLPYTIDRSRTRASFSNGILKIHGPKHPKAIDTLAIE